MNVAGIGDVVVAAMAALETAPDQLEIVPQLLAVTCTLPPTLVSDAGENAIAHDGGGGVPPPGDVQETTRLPLLGETETVEGWQVMLCDVCASVGTGAEARKNPPVTASSAVPENRKI